MVLYFNQFSHDAESDLFRPLGINIHPNRSVDLIDHLVLEPGLMQSFNPFFMCTPAAQCADIADIGPEQQVQCLVIDLRIMGQQYCITVLIEVEFSAGLRQANRQTIVGADLEIGFFSAKIPLGSITMVSKSYRFCQANEIGP